LADSGGQLAKNTLTGIVKLLIGETNNSRVVRLAIGGTKCFGVRELGFHDLQIGSITLLRTPLYSGLLPGYLSDTGGSSDTLACLRQGAGTQDGNGRAAATKVIVLAEVRNVGLDSILDSLDIAVLAC
jgi:hypothetical protein